MSKNLNLRKHYVINRKGVCEKRYRRSLVRIHSRPKSRCKMSERETKLRK